MCGGWTTARCIRARRVDRGSNGDEFAVEFTYDITFTPTGKRSTMNEIARYIVRDGKIAQDKFYYGV